MQIQRVANEIPYLLEKFISKANAIIRLTLVHKKTNSNLRTMYIMKSIQNVIESEPHSLLNHFIMANFSLIKIS